MENIAFFHIAQYPELIGRFRMNLSRMWKTGESEALYENLSDEIADGTADSFPIVFDPMALTWSQVTKLKSLIRSECDDINSSEMRERPEEHWYCER
jgi:hypothetical protein